VIDKQQISYRLEVNWSVEDKGVDPDRDPIALSTTQHPCSNPAHKSHAECGPTCNVHRDFVTQSVPGGSRDLPDAMAAAHRDSLAQNKEIGSAGFSFESASSNIRRQVRAWAERPVPITLRASGVSCHYTTADFRFHRYELKLSWKWYRTTSHLVGGRWTPPVEEQLPISGSPTEAVVMVAPRIDPTPVSKHDVLFCGCGRQQPPPPPEQPQAKTGTDNRTPTYSGLGVNPRPGQTTTGGSTTQPKKDEPRKEEPRKDEPKTSEPEEQDAIRRFKEAQKGGGTTQRVEDPDLDRGVADAFHNKVKQYTDAHPLPGTRTETTLSSSGGAIESGEVWYLNRANFIVQRATFDAGGTRIARRHHERESGG
jgi:hypothetical protein